MVHEPQNLSGPISSLRANFSLLEDEFIAKYGDCEELDSADFDFVSKAWRA